MHPKPKGRSDLTPAYVIESWLVLPRFVEQSLLFIACQSSGLIVPLVLEGGEPQNQKTKLEKKTMAEAETRRLPHKHPRVARGGAEANARRLKGGRDTTTD